MITKYPPIEGGVSSRTYWLAKNLGELGHEVFVVSNCWEVEQEYREVILKDELDNFEPKNVRVFSTTSTRLSYIPYFNAYTEKIASLAIRLTKKYDLDVIDTWYLLPYGIAGYITKKSTGKPLIIRHAGSDTRLFDSLRFRTLIVEALHEADIIGTNDAMKAKISELGISSEKMTTNLIFGVDTDAFKPNTDPTDISRFTDQDVKGLPVFTFLGKAEAKKGIIELIKASSGIKEDFILLLVTGGKGLDRLKNMIKKYKLEEKTIFLPFQPPWKIPSIIAASTCVLTLEHSDYPVKTHSSIVPREAMACGRCAVLSNSLFQKINQIRYSGELIDGKNVIVVDPKNEKEFKEKLMLIMQNPNIAKDIGKEARRIAERVENPKKDVQNFINAYERLSR